MKKKLYNIPCDSVIFPTGRRSGGGPWGISATLVCNAVRRITICVSHQLANFMLLCQTGGRTVAPQPNASGMARGFKLSERGSNFAACHQNSSTIGRGVPPPAPPSARKQDPLRVSTPRGGDARCHRLPLRSGPFFVGFFSATTLAVLGLLSEHGAMPPF